MTQASHSSGHLAAHQPAFQAPFQPSFQAVDSHSARLLKHFPSFGLPRFELARAGESSRVAMEAYIRGRFANAHRAAVTHFLPNLISLGNDERYCAAVGLAPASEGPLFAEIYLDRPIEDEALAQSGIVVPRHDILEIGNLVSTWKGSSLLLFVFLSELVMRLNYPWVVFTATKEVERLLARLGYQPMVLASAAPERLADVGRSWGSYYEHAPRVMFGEVAPAVERARKSLLYRSLARTLAGQVERIAARFPARTRPTQVG